MPTKAALTYDEITRKTVLEPDTSVRPSKGQEVASIEQGARDPHPEETRLRARARDVLASLPGLDIATIAIELDGATVVLRGTVPDAATLQAIDEAFTTRDVPFNNRLVVS